MTGITRFLHVWQESHQFNAEKVETQTMKEKVTSSSSLLKSSILWSAHDRAVVSSGFPTS